MKRLNPYTRLLNEIKKWAYSAKYRSKTTMFYIQRKRLSEGWAMNDIWERTKAAEQLGYEVILEAKDDALYIKYIKAVPEIPWKWR